MARGAGPASRREGLVVEGRAGSLARLAGGAGVIVGATVLLGWAVGLPKLEKFWPGLPLVQPDAALGFVAAGLALMGSGPDPRRPGLARVARAFAALTAAIGLLNLAGYAFGSGFGIEIRRIVRDQAGVGPPWPGRMLPMTAACLFCLGLALAWIDARSWVLRSLSQAFAVATVLLTLLELIGTAYGVDFLYLICPDPMMPMPSALTLLVLGVGTLAARPGFGLMRRFTADDAGSWLLRHLVPLAVALPLALGGLRLVAEKNGWFNAPFGSAVLVLCNIVTLMLVLGWSARRLTALDGRWRQAQRLVRDQEQWLRTTLTSIGDAVIVTDPEGRVTFINSAAQALTGWSTAEAAGVPMESVFRIVNEVTRRPVENPGRRALRERAVVGLASHTILIAKDGGERAIDDSAAPIRDGDEITGVVLVFRDVTASRQVERALVESERRLQTSLTIARMAAWEWNPGDDQITMSEQMTEVLGLLPDERPVDGAQGLALLHPDDQDGHRDRLTRAVETGGAYHGRFRVIRPVDGRVAWIEDWAQADVGGPGGVARMVGLLTDISERVRAEEEVRDARSRLESTLASGEVGTWEFDPAANVVHADRNLARMFGVTPEEADGGELAAYIRAIHPDDQGRVAREIGDALAGRSGYESEYRIVQADGGSRWVIARGRVVADPDGPGLRMPGVVVDITMQKRAEERERRLAEVAAEAGAKLRAFFEQSASFAGIMDLDGTVIEVNRVCWEGCGFTKEQIIGRRFWEGPWWSRSDALTEKVRDACGQAAAGLAYRSELPYFVADGGERAVEMSIMPIKDEAGRVLFLAPTGIDITDRKRAEGRFLESETRLRFALKAGRMGAWRLDLGSGLLTSSETCKANYGFEPSEPFTYEHLSASVLEEDRPGWSGAVEEALARCADLDVEYRTRWPDGSIHWVCVRASCAAGEDGRAAEMTGVSFNIDDRKRSEEALRDADRRKDEFLATLAHELRNPLAPIRNVLQIMRVAGDDRDAIEEARTLMERQVTHMVRLIDDLMDVSRITRNKLELRRERLDMATIIRNAVETSRPLVEASGHELTVTLPAEPIEIFADVTRLSQVFSNLLNNAAKYTEAGGAIELIADRQGGEVAVTVRDNGVGIPPEMIPHVFDMFTQVDRSLERSQGGLGIGLTLVQTLVGMHQGTVEARSAGHGHGSEFVVKLPIAPLGPTPTAARQPDRPQQAAALPGIRILVVDDNRDSARTLARLLKLLGHATSTANDGGEAIEVAERDRPALILLDIGMPVMNGYDVAREIRSRPWGRDPVIIALTGWGQEDDRRRSRESGIDHHLVKPVDPEVLERLLAEIRPVAPAGLGDGRAT